MINKASLSVLIVATTLAIGAGCKGSEEVKTDAPPPPPAATTAAGATTTTAATGEVATYPTEVAQGGTVLTQQTVKVFQAADSTSTLVTTLGPGTLVETKARYGDWMKINWPSGVGKLSPGWCQASFLAAPKVVVDAGVDSSAPAASASAPDKIPAPTQPSASAAPTPSATPATSSSVRVRPILKLPAKRQ